MAWKPIPGALEELRHSVKLTREELAKRSRMSARAIADIESGRTEAIRLDTLRKLTRALRCSDTEIATWIPDRHLTTRRRLWVPASIRDVLLRLGEDSAVGVRLETVVERHVQRVLKACDFNRELGAEVLGVSTRELDNVTGQSNTSRRRKARPV